MVAFTRVPAKFPVGIANEFVQEHHEALAMGHAAFSNIEQENPPRPSRACPHAFSCSLPRTCCTRCFLEKEMKDIIE